MKNRLETDIICASENVSYLPKYIKKEDFIKQSRDEKIEYLDNNFLNSVFVELRHFITDQILDLEEIPVFPNPISFLMIIRDGKIRDDVSITNEVEGCFKKSDE